MTLSLRGLISQKEFWIFLFAVAWMLFNWPLIKLAEGHIWIGTPATLIYVASIWLVIIFALYLFDRGSIE